MFDNEAVSVPITGLYNIDIDDVSPDVNESLMRYMFSAERHKKLIAGNLSQLCVRVSIGPVTQLG